MKARVLPVDEAVLSHTKHDREILSAIQETGVRPNIAEVTKVLGLPKSTVHDAYDRMETNYEMTATITIKKKKPRVQQ